MNPLRVLLIDPPFYRLYKDTYGLCKYPLGMAHLAATIREFTAAEVRVINVDFHPSPEPFSAAYLTTEGFASYRRNLTDQDHPAYDRLQRCLHDFTPNLVGITVRTPVLGSALLCARIVKATVPEALVVAGGPHPTVTGADLLAHPDIDMVALGEGESTIKDIITAMASSIPPESVPGLIIRRNGHFRWTGSRSMPADIDSLPFAHKYAEDVLEDYGHYPPSAFGYVFSSRGCPFGCAFCSSPSVWGRKVRCQSPERLLAELAALRRRGVTHVHFDDDTFGLTEKRLLVVCRALEEAQLGLTFSAETHVRLISEASVAAMARAGFSRVQLGLESGDNNILARIGKGITVEQALTAARRIKDAGLGLEAFFMVGFPEETETSLAATRRLMEILDCDKLIYSIFTPYPGTRLYHHCLQVGLIRPDHDYSRHNHQSPENCFCPQIPPDRFRILAQEIETLVTAKNAMARGKVKTATSRAPGPQLNPKRSGNKVFPGHGL